MGSVFVFKVAECGLKGLEGFVCLVFKRLREIKISFFYVSILGLGFNLICD